MHYKNFASFFTKYNQLPSKLCKIYWQCSIKKWFEKDFEKYQISYVLIVDFADPEIILAGECSLLIRMAIRIHVIYV